MIHAIYRHHWKFLLTLLSIAGSINIVTESASALNITRLSSLGNSTTAANNFGAEIPAYDPSSRRLFLTGPNNRLDIADISNPASPITLSSLDLSSYGAGVNSVAIKNGIVALAMEANPITNNGSVVFFDTNGVFQSQVTVGALPDMLTFTPDGNRVLVANEGEPANGVNPDGSVSIIDLSAGVLNPTVNTATFTSFNGQENTFRSQGVRIFPGQTVSQDVEPEYITVSDDGTTAWVSLQENNAIAIVNIVNAQVTSILPLGAKNFNAPGNGLDPSDQDGVVFGGATNSPAVRINNWPVFGLYQPDTIATVTIAGQTYLISANEGDTRNEARRVSTLTLDPNAFPNAATLKLTQNLGRLDVSSIDGLNGQGQYSQLFAYGGRSFSIWNVTNGLSQVFDSGDDFEQILATFSATPLTPSIFNSDGTPSSFDSRSDNRGPEPEGLAVGSVRNRLYSFVGIERAGGFMVYDITNPSNPLFTNYINDSQLGDISPEGLLFIPAADSPNGTPLLIVANEVSRNVAIYSVKPVPEPSAVLGLVTLGLAGYGLKKRGNC
ncbi:MULTISPECIES: choice-of-anchor I family protein [unclassified Microcystis]|uniref:PEP-CTERM sorting domain-containing protein n=1 Tax=Microcystis flos-aquae Mf_QC_C_20070823_S10D TaxID=2486236 RepID=A0A552KXY4_9CHRO|nr:MULTISPECIES: choice-of-anchor I family protein [unclassified Microcystis]MCA2818920.1 choice-of-anchor I family protein [Microcystis sp. M085S1]MCA2854520.1 choice-of-anchor I family protein [Microcystis sp. M065S1]TRT75346.1 MAG: PEP-CTERM sorting domain-containing protein [Microcystis flos-aquae Ma_QC_C_20070823_S18]TRT93345.1 MAG: PEP-CTERM sorting domain-containing protein [Microcystis flos-aquae Ma_QC_C_20070823_S18D]TRV12844.1 MAG: PEP-CTERM sorting domain-containing protein [Microcy